MIYMFLVGQVSWLVENINIGIFSDTINIVNVKLFIMVLHIELYLFITIFQGHGGVKQFLTENFMLLSD